MLPPPAVVPGRAGPERPAAGLRNSIRGSGEQAGRAARGQWSLCPHSRDTGDWAGPPGEHGTLGHRLTGREVHRHTHRDKHTENGPAHADGTGRGGGTQTDTQTRTLRKRTGHAAHVHTKHDHRARVSGRSHYTGNKETNTSQFAPGGRSHLPKSHVPGPQLSRFAGCPWCEIRDRSPGRQRRGPATPPSLALVPVSRQVVREPRIPGAAGQG